MRYAAGGEESRARALIEQTVERLRNRILFAAAAHGLPARSKRCVHAIAVASNV